MSAYPNMTLHALFDEQARRTPDAAALIDSDGTMSFRMLNERANALAHRLVDLGVRPRSMVGICLDRSREAVIAALGVLKAGAAYVPLDPVYPPARLAFFAADTGLERVVTRECLRARLPPGLDAVCVDDGVGAAGAQIASAPRVAVSPDDWCFVVYTSGSTGKPKGVGSPHRGSVVMFSWLWHAHPFEAGERFCHRTTLNFIVSAWELFAPLLQGVPVALAPPPASRDPRALIAFLDAARVTRLLLVPTLLRAMLATMEEHALALPFLRHWICVGEPLQTELARRLFAVAPAATLLNLYGCSETHSALCYAARGSVPDLPSVPIGSALSNRRIHLLDDRCEPVAPGDVGEIYIGGDGISRGYIQRPQLSSERFVAVPAVGEELCYRTGDRGRLLADGNVQLLGRADRQVQVRGHRVELVEVEATLLAHGAVRQCAVTVRDVGGDLELAAYLVATATTPAQLREFIGSRLPEAMIPSSFTFLDALPTTPNGKLDHLALPDPARARALATPCVAPRTPTESTLVDIWTAVLALHPIGVHDSFFDLGGYSNKATTALLQIRNEFGIQLELEAFFKLQTVERIAAEIDARRWLAASAGSAPDDLVRGSID